MMMGVVYPPPVQIAPVSAEYITDTGSTIGIVVTRESGLVTFVNDNVNDVTV